MNTTDDDIIYNKRIREEEAKICNKFYYIMMLKFKIDTDTADTLYKDDQFVNDIVSAYDKYRVKFGWSIPESLHKSFYDVLCHNGHIKCDDYKPIDDKISRNDVDRLLYTVMDDINKTKPTTTDTIGIINNIRTLIKFI